VLFQAHQEYVTDRLNDFESHINVRLDVAEDNNAARSHELQAGLTGLAGQVQGLAAGQQQILELLTGGKPKQND
jgi:hypothetical protein